MLQFHRDKNDQGNPATTRLRNSFYRYKTKNEILIITAYLESNLLKKNPNSVLKYDFLTEF